MGSAAFRDPREHVADLLPAFLTGTLESADRIVVQRHLATCEGCMTALAAWRAIAGATAQGVARFDSDATNMAPPHALPTRTPFLTTHKERSTMSQPMFAAMPIARPLRGSNRRTIGRALAPVSRIAAVIAIVLSAGAGIFAYLNNDPNGQTAALAPASQTGECTAEPLTDEQLAVAVYLPGTMDGTNRTQASFMDPAISIDRPDVLPADAPVSDADAGAVRSLWDNYQACLASEPNRALALMSPDGLRRIYYRYVYNNMNVTFEDRAANDPKVIAADATRAAAVSTPEATKPAPAGGDANIGQYRPSVPTGFVIRDLKTTADGRVIAGLDNPNCSVCRPEEYEGLAVFVKIDGEWKIDDATVFHG